MVIVCCSVGIADVRVVLVWSKFELDEASVSAALPGVFVAVPAAPPPGVFFCRSFSVSVWLCRSPLDSPNVCVVFEVLSRFSSPVTVTVDLPGPSMLSRVACALAAMRRFHAASVERRSAALSPMPALVEDRSWPCSLVTVTFSAVRPGTPAATRRDDAAHRLVGQRARAGVDEHRGRGLPLVVGEHGVARERQVDRRAADAGDGLDACGSARRPSPAGT